MASQGDLKRLRERLRELEKIESKYKHLQEDCHEQGKAIDHWKAAHQTVIGEKDQLVVQVKTLEQRLDAKEEELGVARSQATNLQRAVERAKKNAKFDNIAREGQTKKLGILEHCIKTLRSDLENSVEFRKKLEDKTKELEHQWANERSLRLQDLHRHEAMASKTHQAGEAVATAEEKWLAAEKIAQKLENTVELKRRELQAQCRINEAQVGETNAQAKEIELLRAELVGSRRILLTKQGQISAGMSAQSSLRQELSRVRRDYIVSTSSCTEHHRALHRGTRSRGKTSSSQGALSSHQNWTRETDLNLGRDRKAGKRDTSWPDPHTTQHNSKNRRHKSPRPTPVFAPSFRQGVSLDDAFLAKVEVPAHESCNGREVSAAIVMGGRNTSGTHTHLLKHSASPVAPAAEGAPMRESLSAGGTPAHLRSSCGTTGSRAIATTNKRDGMPSTSLGIAGSLYVGMGLGLKKYNPWSPPGGSSKDALRKILEKHMVEEAFQTTSTGKGK